MQKQKSDSRKWPVVGDLKARGLSVRDLGVVVLVCCTLLAGCSARRPPSTVPDGRDADIGDTSRTQTGYATYVAQSFHGRKSASGENFDARQLVAAHRSLPFGTVVRVTNLENGRAVTVRIIDRGPYGKNFREGTIIDLSRAAARRVGMIQNGQVRVRLVIIRRATPDTS